MLRLLCDSHYCIFSPTVIVFISVAHVRCHDVVMVILLFKYPELLCSSLISNVSCHRFMTPFNLCGYVNIILIVLIHTVLISILIFKLYNPFTNELCVILNKVVLSDSMDTLQQPPTNFRIYLNSTNMSINYHTKHLIVIKCNCSLIHQY